MGESEQRDATIIVRVRQSAKDRFKQLAANRGMQMSDAAREALSEWVTRHQDPR